MKFALAICASFAMAVMLNAVGDKTGVVYVGHATVATALAKGGHLVDAEDQNFIVQGSHRDKAGNIEFHTKEADIFYVTKGDATLVAGGTLVGGKTTGPDQMTGTEIKGGQTYHLATGDVMVIPAGTPHWFSQVPGPFDYLVVHVIKP